MKESPTNGKDKKLTFPDVERGSDIDWTIRLQGGVLAITVNGTTQEENVLENDRAWADQTFYFKAGAYPQDNAGEVSEGARVSFSRLVVTHSDD
ncbi:protein containing Alginate lyase 2 domain protein [Rhodopirellula europaea 6C]|uniref:Protein containing Alginate lyase 2 domain protein n=1 Tax=Rhodopirellula europaea 6C TaxID=1263867 RepID=M2A661_9BACT|nr:protein containing Alginate lyase 2 domain protein [Rhodopirellula europaea 6C]